MNFKHEKVKKLSYSGMMTSSLFNEKDILSRKNTNTIQTGCRNLGQCSGRNYEHLRRRNAIIGSRARYTSDCTDVEEIEKRSSSGHNWLRPMSSCDLNETSYISNDTFLSSPNLAAGTYEIEPELRKASPELYYEQISTDLSDDITIHYTHWSDWLPEDVVQSLDKQQFKLQEAIWEFIVTESTFLANLKIILGVFLPQLNRLKYLDLIDDIHPQNIFGGINEIYKSHIKFWKQCPQRCMKEAGRGNVPLSEEKIIEYFPINFELHFEEYLSHCLFAPKYQDQLLNSENNLCFKEYLRWCQEHKYSKHKGLGDFILEPMQHVMRYTLLINAIKSHSSSIESKIKLGKLAENVEAFLTQVNSKLREQEEMEIVKQINNNLEISSFMEPYGHEEKFLSKYYKFDLLAPMPGLPFSMARILLKFSKLKMRDLSTRLSSLRTTFLPETSSGFVSVNIYLFTDTILIGRETKRGTISLLKHPIILETVILEKRSQDQFFLISQSEFNMPIEILCFKKSNPKVIDSWLDAIKRASDEFINAKKDFESENCFMRHIMDIKRDNYFATNHYSSECSQETSKRNSELSETLINILDTNREENLGTLFTTYEDFEPKESSSVKQNYDCVTTNGRECSEERFQEREREINKVCVVRREVQEKSETNKEINTKITRTIFKIKTEERRIKKWRRKSNSFSLFSCFGGRFKRIEFSTD